MTLQQTPTSGDRFLPSGDEAGTSPQDRRFRPDVEGLRAVAVVLVVLYHSKVPGLQGGYVGVDVFFVISGFVITGLLLRERQGTGSTSLLDFYARRARRILPAATLVIIVTVLFSFLLIGVISGINTADDGRWAAAFLSNFHFESVGTNYLDEFRPPSPLQNYWSLSVEEQFYVVYPALFLLVAGIRSRWSMRSRLTMLITVIIIGSYALSITQTASQPASAYFSPFTRAWELALGALVAVSTVWLKRMPAQMAMILTWVGLVAIVASAFAFNAQTAYPGSLVAIPVVGAGLIIAGGVAIPRYGAEAFLGLTGPRWLGRISYSLYLWHWPILVIAAESVGRKSLPVWENLLLVVGAVLLSMATYRMVENPLRHWKLPSKKSVLGGLSVVAATVLVLTFVINVESTSGSAAPIVPALSNQVVLDQVSASRAITSVPSSIQPSLATASNDFGGKILGATCIASVAAFKSPICPLGDPSGKKLMVAYGDSHVLMWIPALSSVAFHAHYRLVVIAKLYCPAGYVATVNPPGWQRPGATYTACDRWHHWAVKWMNNHRASVVIVSQRSLYSAPSINGSAVAPVSAQSWQEGLTNMLDGVTVPGVRKIVLGDIPVLPQAAPVCLENHPNDVQACSSPATKSISGFNAVEQKAAAQSRAQYVDTTPWFCTTICTPIVKHYVVYMDQFHMSATYAKYLRIVLGQALAIQPAGQGGS